MVMVIGNTYIGEKYILIKMVHYTVVWRDGTEEWRVGNISNISIPLLLSVLYYFDFSEPDNNRYKGSSLLG